MGFSQRPLGSFDVEHDQPAQSAPSLTDAAGEPVSMIPVAPGERILAVDVIRGFALFGILLVNMAFFSAPFDAILMNTPWWPALPDRIVTFAVHALAEGKFYILFSLLFGLGMAIQMERAAARGRSFAGYYVRRLLVLLPIGLAHALLLWYGDILTAYAVTGFLLLAFRRRRDRTILIWTAVIYVLPIVILGLLTGLLEVARHIPDAAAKMQQQFAAQQEIFRQRAAEAVENYAHGSWGAMFQQRLNDLGSVALGYLYIAPMVATMFLLGLYVGRRRILHEPEAHLPLLRRLAYWGLPLGLLCNLGYAGGIAATSRAEPTMIFYLAFVLQCIGAPALGFGYAAVLVLLLRHERWRQRLLPLAAVGRMALTNYLLQTLICTSIFYSFGLGLFNRIGPAYGLLLALTIYAAQVPLSTWWLGRFRFGPMEWLWRTLTYGKPQPMRLRSS